MIECSFECGGYCLPVVESVVCRINEDIVGRMNCRNSERNL